MVAVEESRSFIGSELSPRYCDLATNRINETINAFRQPLSPRLPEKSAPLNELPLFAGMEV